MPEVFAVSKAALAYLPAASLNNAVLAIANAALAYELAEFAV